MSLEQDSVSGERGKQTWNSILEIEQIKHADRLNMGHERKKEIKDDFWFEQLVHEKHWWRNISYHRI